MINVFSADYIAGGISRAENENADAVLITMDTPGGVDTAMRKIIQAILNTRLPVLVYVSPQGARAASAGLFITQAADVVAMAPGTNIGSAHPVLVDATGSTSSNPTPSVEDEKVLNDSVAYIQSLASLHHRNADWAADAVGTAPTCPPTRRSASTWPTWSVPIFRPCYGRWTDARSTSKVRRRRCTPRTRL